MRADKEREMSDRDRVSVTLGSTQSGVTDAGVLVVSEMEEGGSTGSVQIDAFVHHSFYNVYSKNPQDPLKHLNTSQTSSTPQ